MPTRDEIINFCNQYLEIEKFSDFGPNGLQVLGKDEVKKVITGVSASLALFEQAAEHKADLVIVHHGEFWQNVSQRVTQVRKQRLKTLLLNDITLAAYHLPLDAHKQTGNNAQLCSRLGFEQSEEQFAQYQGQTIGVIGTHKGKPVQELVEELDRLLATKSLVLNFGPDQVKKIGFVSGGGAGELSSAINLGLDTFVTGESKESTFHLASEAGINLIYAHHYNSEKLGIQALGKIIQKKFAVQVEFIDIPCPL